MPRSSEGSNSLSVPVSSPSGGKSCDVSTSYKQRASYLEKTQTEVRALEMFECVRLTRGIHTIS